MDWKIVYSINDQRMNSLVGNWNVVLAINFDSEFRLSLDFNWLDFVVEYSAVNFWNYCQRNVMFVSNFESADFLFLIRNDHALFANLALFNDMDWNVLNSCNYYLLLGVSSNWFISLSIYTDYVFLNRLLGDFHWLVYEDWFVHLWNNAKRNESNVSNFNCCDVSFSLCGNWIFNF